MTASERPPPTITALRERRKASVLVELDGRPWRTVPVEVAARAGLSLGLALDRPRLRLLARELRRSRAFALAGRTLRRRDAPTRALDARLERAGVPVSTRREALDALTRAGALDDGRFAEGRARALAERGYGDAAIRWHLEREGLGADLIEAALASLEPERERAQRLVARRRPARSAGWLARRGFGDDAIESVLGERAGADG